MNGGLRQGCSGAGLCRVCESWNICESVCARARAAEARGCEHTYAIGEERTSPWLEAMQGTGIRDDRIPG